MLEISVPTSGTASLSIADGGLADWTRRLLTDGKERLSVSGIGLDA
jgi:hypothetical protein